MYVYIFAKPFFHQVVCVARGSLDGRCLRPLVVLTMIRSVRKDHIDGGSALINPKPEVNQLAIGWVGR